jgi:TRAP-type C4-dicarboxylate transport system permease small subunit
VTGKIAGFVDRIMEALLATLMALMCVIVFLGVFCRYVLVQPIGWTEEVGRFSLIWASLIGSYLAYRRLEHIQVDAIYRRLPAATRRVLRIGSTALLAAFMAALTVEGVTYSRAFLTSYSPITDTPLGAVYIALPLTCSLMVVAALSNLIGELRGISSEPPDRGDPL